MPPVPELPDFRLTVARAGERTVVAAAGEMDLVTAGDFDTTVREHLAAGPVLLDLRELSFMDSSGVRALDALLRDVDRQGWSLAVHPDLHGNVRQILEITGMLSSLPMEDDRRFEEGA